MKHKAARIWFFTDFHGSTACFRKFLRAVENRNKPNVLILGADITGKKLVPFVEEVNDRVAIPLEDGSVSVIHAKDVSDAKKAINDVGCYVYECTKGEYGYLAKHESEQEKVAAKLAKERVAEWVTMADRYLPSREECQVIVNAGNDDPFEIDQVLDKSQKLIRPEGRVLDLPCGLKLLSTGFATETKLWNCPRNVSEKNLGERISAMLREFKAGDGSKMIFNFHCPPFGTLLDLADAID